MNNMYRVTTRQPHKILRQEYWVDKLRAEIRRELINHKSDEITGAIVEAVEVCDLDEATKKPLEVELSWPDYRSLSDISMTMQMSPDASLYFDLDVDCKIDEMSDVRFEIHLSGFVYHDETGSEALPCISYDVRENLKEMVVAYTDEHETFQAYESEEVDEANRRSFDDSHPEPTTM